MIVLGREGFSERLAKELRAEFARIETKVFPDGESYFRISEPEKIRGKKAILVVRGRTPNLDQNRMLTESFLLLDKLKALKAKKTCLLLPYIPYSRQDREFLKGETVSVKTVRNLLKEKCDLLVNVTSHDFRKEGWIDKKTYNIDATESVTEFLKSKKFENPVVMAPDMSVSENVEELAKSLGGNSIGFEKERDLKTGKIRTFGKIPNLRGRELIIYDDVASFGETLYKAVLMGKKAKASKIICILIHVLSVYNKKFEKNSIDLIKDESDEYYSSDTIESPITKFSIIKQVSEFLKENF
ncbi:MAG: ribose-phosphate diphosphokinase [Candidatus Aenigmarchaeota archaeon]|nr:ribose-phosphate diphosphokinase [Candidatus Aenigmarchaeota archaeon]NIP40302.1 ribose-phosphate diphosphokinase [Candidatus Aenigmarchaeota archaeon]NIQ17794.1 ribose-phosphate diphosphokinase [Candidatus Aenigmarchaeota archaeon]NIS73177.1 ribose-phosphate diphosphokinase [Candidatus Aenigmarchaeota archaeon]